MAQPGQNPGQFNGPPQGQMGHYGIGDFSRSQGLTARPYAPPSAPPQQQSKGPSGPGAQPPTSVGSQPPQQSKGPGAPGAAPGSGLAQPDVMRRPGTGGGDVNDIMRIPAALPGTGGVYPQAQPASNVGAPGSMYAGQPLSSPQLGSLSGMDRAGVDRLMGTAGGDQGRQAAIYNALRASGNANAGMWAQNQFGGRTGEAQFSNKWNEANAGMRPVWDAKTGQFSDPNQWYARQMGWKVDSAGNPVV